LEEDMTLQSSGQVVRLSIRDWTTIIAVTVTLMTLIFGAYLRQDRMLSELMVLTRMQQERLAKLERQFESITYGRPHQ
jgi:hypothetical protein